MLVVEVEPDLGARTPPLQAARCLDVVVEGALEHILAAARLPGSFPLRVRVPGVVGHTAGEGVLD